MFLSSMVSRLCLHRAHQHFALHGKHIGCVHGMSGASKTGIVHGVRAVEAMGDEKSADSLFHPNARKKKKGYL